jgi:hypothetical protein
MGAGSRALKFGFEEARFDLAISCLPLAKQIDGAIPRCNNPSIGLSPIQMLE